MLKNIKHHEMTSVKAKQNGIALRSALRIFLFEYFADMQKVKVIATKTEIRKYLFFKSQLDSKKLTDDVLVISGCEFCVALDAIA